MHFDRYSFFGIKVSEFFHGLPNQGLKVQQLSFSFTFERADRWSLSSFGALRMNFWIDLAFFELFAFPNFFFSPPLLIQEPPRKIIQCLIFNQESSGRVLSNFEIPLS